MPDYQAGSASIRIGVDMRGFDRDLRSELEARDVELGIGIKPDLASIADLQEKLDAVSRSEDLHVDVKVRAQTSDATTELERWRAEQNTQPIRQPVEVDREHARRSAKDASADIKKALGELKEAGRLNLGVLALDGAPGVITSLLSVADGAAKATHAIGLLPSVATAAAVSLGALKIGLHGVSDVLKDMATISANPIAAAREQADAAHSLEDAEYRVAAAQRTVQTTGREMALDQKALTDAYRETSRSIRDMNNELESQKLSTEDAALGVQEAAKRLMEVQHDPTADATTRRRAELQYQESIQRLTTQQNKTKDLAEDTARANAKGVDGADAVIAAKQKIADAANAEVTAAHELTDATYELSKAQKTAAAGGTEMQKLAEKMAQLSPNAQQAVTAIRSLEPAWKDMRTAAQDALFDRLGDSIKTLADAQLPNLKTGLTGVNAALNTGLRATLIELSSKTNQLDFRQFLQNTTTGLENLAKGAAPLTDGITKLVTVGSQFFPQFGTELAGAAQRFDNLIQRTSADGSLKKWIQDGLTSAHELIQTVEHVGSSIASISRAASAGGTGLQGLESVTRHIADFLKSPTEQNKLEQLFAAARTESEKWKPILADLPGLIKGVAGGVTAWSQITMPFLKSAADLLSAHPGLVRDIVTAYLAFKTVGPIFDGLKASMGLARDTMAGFREGMGTTGTASGGLSRALGGVSGFLGGPWGLAIAGGVTALGFLASAHNNAAQAAEEQKRKLEELQGTLDKTTGLTTEQTLQTAGAELQNGGFFTRAKSFGIDPNTFLHATVGLDDQNKGTINDQLTRTILEHKSSAGGKWSDIKMWTGLSDEDIAKALQGVPDAVKKYTDALAAARKKIEEGGGDQKLSDLSGLKSSLDTVGESAATLGGEMNGYATQVGTAIQRQQELNEAMHGTFDLTDQGRKQFEELGASVVKVPDAKTILVKALTADQQANLEKLGDTVERLPDGTIKITVSDQQAREDIKQITTAPYQAKIQLLVDPVQIQLDRDARQALHPGSGDGITITGGHVGGRATGGRLPTTGPGTERRDGFLAVNADGRPLAHVDGGEWVVNRDRSAEYHRELSQINAGTFPHLPGYEDGGVLPGDSTTQQADTTQQPTTKTTAAANTQAVEDLAKSLAGQPYGGALDCSGLISELSNVAVGLPANTGRMSTANEGEFLKALGFQSGTGGLGTFSVGWINDPSMSGGGHTAGTLPSGINIESSGSAGKVLYGGNALGANAGMFINHAYLTMGTGVGVVPNNTSVQNATNTNTQTVVNPQAALPGAKSDSQISIETDKAAVDSANTERNAVYANPNSTAQDKHSADLKYQQAQNTLQAAMKKSGSADISVQGIAGRAAGILATGVLSFFGLENSIFSSSNTWNQSLSSLVTGLEEHGAGSTTGYTYVPQNLPTIVTTQTAQGDPSQKTTIPTEGPVSGSPVVNTDLGTINVNVGGGTPSSTGASGAAVDAVKKAMAPVGWDTGSEWNAVDQLVSHESSWNPTASAEPASDAYGLFQFLSTTWATVGGQKTSDPYTQGVYGEKYIAQRYGDPLSAWSFWQSQNPHWYDSGGSADGVGFLPKNVIAPERVLSPHQTQTYDSMLPLMERINAQAGWARSYSVDPISGSRTAPTAAANRDHSINFHGDTYVMNNDQLVTDLDRWNSMQAQGVLAAHS